MPKLKNVDMLVKIANSIRCITMDVVAHAGSGHPGMPLGCAEILSYLYGQFMQYHPHAGGKWVNRDRFVLSAGHGALGQLIPLHMAGFDISINDLKHHRGGSHKASSHPLYNPTIGIETTTGADGYGIGNAVGMALGQKILANQLYQDNKALFDEKIIVIGGDGCFMEGISYEAAQIAGHLKLNNLIIIYDSNNITLDGYVSESCSTDYVGLYKALGFDVYEIDGHDFHEIAAVFEPLRACQDKPVFIIANTQIGRGLSEKQGKISAHSGNLKEANICFDQKKLFLNHQPWVIPTEIYDFFEEKHKFIRHKIKLIQNDTNINKEKILESVNQLSTNNLSLLPGRFISQHVLNHLAKHLPQIYSGSADSAQSDGSWLVKHQVIDAQTYQGRNIKFGVREFAMAAVANGLAQTGYIIPVIGGFLAFSDYLKAVLRFSAMMQLKIICSFSHDSILLGEDGPTHQPIEQLAMFRAMPNTLVIRPADVNEIKFAWVAALQHNGPTIIALPRQQLPNLHLGQCYDNTLNRGAYIIRDNDCPQVVLYASGSEVKLALDVFDKLTEMGMAVRVISVPSFELFDRQEVEYKSKILNNHTSISVSIEAASDLVWHKFLGKKAITISVNDYGVSDQPNKVAEKFGFNVENIVRKIMKNIFYKLTLVTNKKNTPLNKYLKFIRECAESGITAVQLREKNLQFSELLDFGKQLQEILSPYGIPLIINDNVELALELDAEGVHLGQSDGSILKARELLGSNKIIGITIDTIEQLHVANSLPIDYIGVGAIFATNNKSNITTVWGCEGLKHLAGLTTHPIIAIGGIDQDNVSQVMKSGAQGIAAIGAFHDTENPIISTQKLRKMIEASYNG